jgi:heterodisulfide reductase subunit C
MISQILFTLLFAAASFLIFKRYRFVRRNIELGRSSHITGDASARLRTMMRVAFGQSKMFDRPMVALLHLIVYLGFIIINIEVIEILIDGFFGTHRVLSFIGGTYDVLIGSFEVLAFLVIVACVAFLIRRNVMNIRRFRMKELEAWPRTDANLILITEIALMSAFLLMNASDAALQAMHADHYIQAGGFPISSFLQPILKGLSASGLIAIERGCWWFHIMGIFAFIVYLSYSKHLHIILAFPNTYFSKLLPAGQISNMESVTNEVKQIMDPSFTPAVSNDPPARFGVKDVFDLSRLQLMSAYSCTECGRCTSECPANQTGKKLSPRKIMMDTRDRMEEVGCAMDQSNGVWNEDGKSLLRDYISEEEIWACTTCNACTQACPVNINPMEIIVDLRRYLIMEESKSPESITTMFNNIENNGAPWAMSAMDRANWTVTD